MLLCGLQAAMLTVCFPATAGSTTKAAGDSGGGREGRGHDGSDEDCQTQRVPSLKSFSALSQSLCPDLFAEIARLFGDH